jgi:uncharacterized membrane protein YvlD (DUF360 family)
MIKFIIRICLTAAIFMFVLPQIPGIHFHGHFSTALFMSIAFGIASFLVDLVTMAISTMLTISTLGLALLVLIPLWAIGFWILPAVALKVTADFMPSNLTIDGWMPAILGGLVLLVVNAATGKQLSQTSD